MTLFRRGLWVTILAAILSAWACHVSQALKSLDSGSRDFLSKVRYIITKQERERFLAIPAVERRDFIEEFWKKRDPTPGTEVNEFRDQYFARIAEANRLFTEAAEPGWLSDRGRIYILLGPPTNRATYPRGVTSYDVPREFWYYGFFIILFTDQAWNGNYKLDPLSAEQISIINRAQKEWQPQIAAEKGQIEFDAKTRKAEAGEVFVEVTIPYRVIWFDSKDKTLRARFVITLDLMDLNGQEIGQTRTEHTFETTEERLRELCAKSYPIEVAIEAKPGEYWLKVTLENINDAGKACKRIRLTVEGRTLLLAGRRRG
jgi:GWxTD domain-containing protein